MVIDSSSKIQLPIRDGYDHRLDGRQPGRKSTGKMFDEHSQEALHGPKNHPMHHDRSMALAVDPHVGQIKTFGEREIALNGGALPPAIQRIPELHIDFGAIERPFSSPMV